MANTTFNGPVRAEQGFKQITKNATTGAIRGIRYNRTGGGQWGKITRLKEQVLQTNKEFKVK